MPGLGRAAVAIALALALYAMLAGSYAAWRNRARLAESARTAFVAAFMRAAYGKGYCDALTEDDQGSLCLDHGYRLPAKRDAERSR